MENSLLIMQEHELIKNARPQEIAQMIIDLTEIIDNSEARVQQIRSRNLLQRIFSNNIRDLADVILDQNQAMDIFLKMMQTIIWINLNNTVVLAEIYKDLVAEEKARGNYENKYLKIAKNFISQTYASAVIFKEKFDTLFEAVKDHTDKINSICEAISDYDSTIIQIKKDSQGIAEKQELLSKELQHKLNNQMIITYSSFIISITCLIYILIFKR